MNHKKKPPDKEDTKMNDRRTIYELNNEEFEELRFFMLFDDENEFYESIDEIEDADVIRRFGTMTFARADFACNRICDEIEEDDLPIAS